ncbi:hypothetical protein BKA93DRAFT_855433 [Sparassis latifolia]
MFCCQDAPRQRPSIYRPEVVSDHVDTASTRRMSRFEWGVRKNRGSNSKRTRGGGARKVGGGGGLAYTSKDDGWSLIPELYYPAPGCCAILALGRSDARSVVPQNNSSDAYPEFGFSYLTTLHIHALGFAKTTHTVWVFFRRTFINGMITAFNS